MAAVKNPMPGRAPRGGGSVKSLKRGAGKPIALSQREQLHERAKPASAGAMTKVLEKPGAKGLVDRNGGGPTRSSSFPLHTPKSTAGGDAQTDVKFKSSVKGGFFTKQARKGVV